MKSAYLLGVLACGLHIEARQVPRAGVVARQWGDGEDEGEGGGGGGWGGGDWPGWPGWPGGGEGGEDEGDWTCVWTDHCLGDPCETEIDCDGDLTCTAGRCANPEPVATAGPTAPTRTTTVYVTVRPTPEPTSSPTCEWTGHCAGDPCETENDCDLDMICLSGRCGDPPAIPVPVTSTRRIITSTRRIVTSTRRVTFPPIPTRTVRPQPTRTLTPGPTRPACGGNPLACIGAECETDADCGFALIICNDGVCGL